MSLCFSAMTADGEISPAEIKTVDLLDISGLCSKEEWRANSKVWKKDIKPRFATLPKHILIRISNERRKHLSCLYASKARVRKHQAVQKIHAKLTKTIEELQKAKSALSHAKERLKEQNKKLKILSQMINVQ